MQFVAAKDYYPLLASKIPKAQSRVVITVMTLTWGPQTAQLLGLVAAAKRRGVAVTLLYDRFSYLPFSFRRPWPWVMWPAVRQLQHYTAELTEAGAQVRRVGSGWSLNPFARRQHAKITIIDNQVFSFGGVNLTDESFDFADYMLYAEDAVLADWLATRVSSIQSRPQPDQAFPHGKQAQVLFDGGNPAHSLIYQRACALARDAAKIYYVSQMCPSGQLAGLLRGKAICYFNRPSQTDIPANLGLAFDQWRFQVPNAYRGKKYIHAKYILFEMKDGSKKLLSGSHNFSWRGVAYGTKEIALESSDENLWQALYGFLQTAISRDGKVSN